MTLSRLNPGPRMGQAVTIGNIVFLAGQVPEVLPTQRFCVGYMPIKYTDVSIERNIKHLGASAT